MTGNLSSKMKKLIDQPNVDQFIKETTRLYFRRMNPVFMVDQINLHHSMKRRSQAVPQYHPVIWAIDLILKSIDHPNCIVYYSSSLNKQWLEAQDPTIQKKYRLKYEEEYHLSWAKNCLNRQRYYETFRFLQFEMTRKTVKLLRGKLQQQHLKANLLTSIKRVFIQLFKKDFYKSQSQIFLPLTLLQIRQYLDDKWKTQQTIYACQGNDSENDSVIKECIKKLFAQKEQFSLQNIISDLWQFIDKIPCQYKPNKIDALWCILQQILKDKLTFQQFRQIPIYQKVVIKSKKLINLYNQKNYQKINKNQPILLSSLNNNLFRWDYQQEGIVTYLFRRYMILLAHRMMGRFVRSANSFGRKQWSILREIAWQNYVLIGSFLDASFSNFVSSCTFTMAFGQNQPISVANNSKKQRHFLHFLGYKYDKRIFYPAQNTADGMIVILGCLFEAIQTQSQSETTLKEAILKANPVNDKQLSQIFSQNFEKIVKNIIKISKESSQQHQSPAYKQQNKSLCKIYKAYSPRLIFLLSQKISENQARSWVNKYFKNLIEQCHEEFKKNESAWVGASPLSKTEKKSFNSPSIDSILMRYQQRVEKVLVKDKEGDQSEIKDVKKKIYHIKTIDYSVQDMSHIQICERIQKSKNYINIISAYFKAAGLQLKIEHMIIASRRVQTRFKEIISQNMPKTCRYTHKDCFDHKKYEVVSFEDFQYVVVSRNLQSSVFDLVIRFARQSIKQRDRHPEK